MKLLTILLLLAITTHQILVPAVNSILLMEAMGFTLFCWFGFKWRRDYSRRKKRSGYLKDYQTHYQTPKETKTWREYQSKTEVQVTKREFLP